MTVHQLDPDVWTPQLMATEILAAIRWANRATGRVGPAGFRSSFASIVAPADEWDGFPPLTDPDDPPPIRLNYTPSKVSRFERILGWQIRYLKDYNDGDTRVLRTFIRARATPKFSFDQACKVRGWSRATAYRGRDRALSAIALELTADGILYGQH